MKIGIICAMKEEFELISKDIEIEKTIKKSNLEFLIGTLNEKNVVGVICGIGKVNAAICTQILISEFNCTHILNSGVAGGIDSKVNFKDVIIAKDLVQHDVDVRKFGYKLGEIPNIGTYSFKCEKKLLEIGEKICLEICKENKNFNYHIGRIVTGDQFISNNELSKNLQKTFDALACEMESGSIAQTCYLNNIPFLIIRAISDTGGDVAENEFNNFLKESSKNSYIIIKNIISSTK